MRTELRNYQRTYYELFTICTTLMQFGMIFALNRLMGVVYILVVFVLVFGGPLLFIYAYRYKK